MCHSNRTVEVLFVKSCISSKTQFQAMEEQDAGYNFLRPQDMNILAGPLFT